MNWINKHFESGDNCLGVAYGFWLVLSESCVRKLASGGEKRNLRWVWQRLDNHKYKQFITEINIYGSRPKVACSNKDLLLHFAARHTLPPKINLRKTSASPALWGGPSRRPCRLSITRVVSSNSSSSRHIHFIPPPPPLPVIFNFFFTIFKYIYSK